MTNRTATTANEGANTMTTYAITVHGAGGFTVIRYSLARVESLTGLYRSLGYDFTITEHVTT